MLHAHSEYSLPTFSTQAFKLQQLKYGQQTLIDNPRVLHSPKAQMHPGEIKTGTIFVTLHRSAPKPREMRNVRGKVG